MQPSSTLFASVLLHAASFAVAAPAAQDFQAAAASASSVFPSTAGFTGTSLTSSFGGAAVCLNGKISLSISASNLKVFYSIPDQLNATQTIQELLQTFPTIYTTALGGPNQVQGTYNIFARLCLPADLNAALKVSTVQVLTHGATLDSTYWDFSSGYSYIDAAAKAGYATFAYDRLGTGKSDHPDPLQVVQAAIQVEVLHQLVTKLRSLPGLGGKLFKKVVGVGHSAGATFTQAVTAKYPSDFDAVLLSGITTSVASVAAAQAGLDLVIANRNSRFYGIANGYFTPSTQVGLQFSFYHYPGFDATILTKQFNQIQTNTLGELLTFATIVGPATTYSNPVFIINGDNDYVFCGGNCELPSDQSQTALAFFYPAVGGNGATYNVPNTGHNVLQHLTVNDAISRKINFLKSKGL